MKYRVIGEKLIVRSKADVKSAIVAELHANDEFTMGITAKIAGTAWAAVKLADGKKGYVAEPSNLFEIRPVILAQNTVDVLKAPQEGAEVEGILKLGDRFVIAGLVKQGEPEWFEVRGDLGDVGYVPATTEIKEVGTVHAPLKQDDSKPPAEKQTSGGLPFGFVAAAAAGWFLMGHRSDLGKPGAFIIIIGAVVIAISSASLLTKKK